MCHELNPTHGTRDLCDDGLVGNPGVCQQPEAARLQTLESKVSEMDRKMQKLKDAGDTSAFLFLFGAFCALWAQNTGRSAWLWFFMGLFFSVITVIVLLYKNSNDKASLEDEARRKSFRID